MGDVHPGGQEDQLVGLATALLRERQGDDDGQTPARAVAHEDDPLARVLREGARVQVQDEAVRLLPRVMRGQRVERHDEARARPAGELVDQQGLSLRGRGDIAASVEVDDDGVRGRVRTDAVDRHAVVLASFDVVAAP